MLFVELSRERERETTLRSEQQNVPILISVDKEEEDKT
jgi:hypothetical protein